MVNIFEYTNYREYLSAFFNDKKINEKKYSFRKFSEDAGIKSINYLRLVIDGKRGITLQNLPKFIKGLGLKDDEAKYFEFLIRIDLTLDFSEKAALFEKLYKFKKHSKVLEFKSDQYNALSKWYYLAMSELILLNDFKNDPGWIAEKFKNKINKDEALEAVKALMRVKLIEEKDGKLVPTDVNLATTDDISNLSIRVFHNAMIEKSLDSLKNDPVEDRDFSSLTMAISTAKLPEIKKIVKSFRKELIKVLNEPMEKDSVYQLNLQLFPLTEIKK